ncbi:nucleoporin Nup85-like protein [Obelidium mucronatum]|nr:nucleoporin Nup85-like protein [Obelidium mucronatum]
MQASLVSSFASFLRAPTPATRARLLDDSVRQRGNIASFVAALAAQIAESAKSDANCFGESARVGELARIHAAASLWLLAEALLLHSAAAHLPSRLLVWLNALDPQPSQAENKALVSDPLPSAHPLFWKYVKKCLLRGHFYAAASMLEKHEFYAAPATSRSAPNTQNVYASLVSLIHAMPKLAHGSTLTQNSKAQLDSSWAQWRRSVSVYKDSARLLAVFGRFEDLEHVAACFGIMAADLNVLSRECLNSGSGGDMEDQEGSKYGWMEALVAYVWYTDPFCLNTGVSSHLELLRSVMDIPVLPENGKLDEDADDHEIFQTAVVALLDLQVDIAVLNLLPQIDFTIATHLVHLLHQLGELDAQEGVDSFIYFSGEDAMKVVEVSTSDKSILSVRDQLLIEYAIKLTTAQEEEEQEEDGEPQMEGKEAPQSNQFVYIAIHYLSHVLETNNGSCLPAKEQLENLLLNRIPFTESNAQFRKLISIARDCGLDSVVKTLRDRYAKSRESQEGREGEAIRHYVLANQIPRANKVAQKLLEGYIKQDDDTSAEKLQVITQMSESIVATSPFLAVLVKLVAFQDFYERKVWNECGAALLELLTRVPTPKWVWARLLADSVLLLESETMVFKVDETFELMRCLEQVVGLWDGKGICKGNSGKGGGMDVDEERIDIEVVRLALSRNLARAMMT